MNWVFTLSGIVILITIPFWLFSLLLWSISHKFKISYQLNSFFNIANIKYTFSTELFSIFITIDKIQLTCTWFRLRFLIINSNISIIFKKINIFQVSQAKPTKRSSIYQEKITTLQEKYIQIIQKLFISRNKSGNKLISNDEIENISKVLQYRPLSILDIIIRNLFNLFDVYLQYLNVNIKFDENDFYHSFIIRKIIFGFATAKNKRNEIDIIGAIYDFTIYEYITTTKTVCNMKHNKIFNLNNKDNAEEGWYCYQLFHLPENVAKIKLGSGIFNPKCSLSNTISINVESKELVGNISTKSLNNAIQLIVDLIAIGKMFKGSHNNKSNPHIEEILEEYIKKLVDDQLKKMVMTIQHIKLNICSDNFIFKHMVIESSEIKVDMHNYFYISYDDKGNISMLSSELLIKLSQLKISQFKNQRLVPITEISIYSIPIKKTLIYNVNTQKAELLMTLSSKLSDVEVILTAENLNKILELVLAIVDGIDLIEYYLKQNFNDPSNNNNSQVNSIKTSENFLDKTNMDFIFDNINAIMYSDEIITFADKISMKILINKWKFHTDEIVLNFSPIKISFSHNEMNNNIINNYYVGNGLVKDFALTITKNRDVKDINISFGETFATAHDIHLLYIMKFISEMIGAILEQDVRKKFGKKSSLKKKKKNNIMLKWNECDIVNYINQEDIIYGQLKDFTLHVDHNLCIPHFKGYHSSSAKCNFVELLTMENFYIEFKMDQREINILFDDIHINAYTSLIASPIQKISTFYKFFPIWIEYYFTWQFVIAEETHMEKFAIERNKKDKVKISFSKIYIGLNDSSISQAAILQAKYEHLCNKTDQEIIKYLQSVKNDLLSLQVTNFDILCDTEKRVMPSKEGSNYYYDSIAKIANIRLRFELIQVSLEKHDLISLKDFKIDTYDQIEWNHFNSNGLTNKTMVISYLKYHIVLYKVDSQIYKYNKCDMQLNNLKFNFEDIKVFDKTLNFIFATIKTVAGLKFIEYETRIFTDQIFTKIDRCFNLITSNLDGTIISIDPKTKQAYSKLDIRVAIFAMTIKYDEVYKVIRKNTIEISLHYFVFGFEPSQKSGFPLLIMPLAEANFDQLNNAIRINIPTEISNKSSYSRLFNHIYSTEINQLVMETKSLTVFINYKYLSTFFKIFEIFWEKTKNLRQSLKNKNTKHTSPSSVIEKKNTNHNINNSSSNNNTIPSSMRLNPLVKKHTVQINVDSRKLLMKEISLLSNSNINNNNEDKSIIILSNSTNQLKKKIMLSLFDLKLIYLHEYQKEYESIFKFNPFVRAQKYFGYIFRLYSFSLKYIITEDIGSFYSDMNLLTISFLDEENFEDAHFFVHDREIKTTKFLDLKQITNFNSFMELDRLNKVKLINYNLRNYLKETDALNEKKYKEERMSSPHIFIRENSNKNYDDLKFDYKHIFAKISNVIFNSTKKMIDNNTDLSLIIDNTKLTWNKFNKDVVILLLFHDVLLIVDKIILKTKQMKRTQHDTNKDNYSTGNNNKLIKVKTFYSNDLTPLLNNNHKDKKDNNASGSSNNNNNNGNKGQMSFVFEIKNPQIVIQNELKKSTLLLMTKEPIKVILSTCLFEDSLKIFNLEFICNYLTLYSAPKCINSDYINWIGNSNDNKYYLDESLFGQILDTPKIYFMIYQRVESYENNEFNVDTTMKIIVDKIKGDFESSYFTDFMNIVEVFLFDRGYSLGEEKGYLDSKKKDMETFKLIDLENLIKNTIHPQGKKPIQKEITFQLGEVIFNLSKGGKTLMQFLLINFEGNHQIFNDKSSETHLNVKNFHIRNAELNRNDIILSPLYSDRLGDYEDKIDIVTFTKKDHFVSIGTDSLWYVLDYLEFNVRPIIINISKTQIEFIIDFFFQDQSIPSDKDQLQVLISSNKIKPDKKKEFIIQKRPGKQEDVYPIYFKHCKVNETEVLLNFEYGEAHPLNIPRTKLKFCVFDKQEKFYPFTCILQRFADHCKSQCIKNLGAILGGLFSSTDNAINYDKKKNNNDAQIQRKLLFGNK